jgi:hypothetical protein
MKDLVFDNNLAQKLELECGIIDWQMLKPHYERGALIIARQGLDLITAGVQIASDNQVLVKQWITDQSLIKPTPEQASDWEQHNTRFKSLVVAPFVLMQIISH